MDLREYERLIDEFVRGSIVTSEFERRYLAAFKAQPGGLPEEPYAILQGLFSAVDCYWEGCTPERETVFEISEKRLRREAATALARLREYLCP